MASSSNQKRKEGCANCQKLFSTGLTKHYKESHCNFSLIMFAEDRKIGEFNLEATDSGYLCPFSCAYFFGTRSSLIRHVKTTKNCEIPEYTHLKSSADNQIEFPEVNSEKEITRTYSTYEESLLLSCMATTEQNDVSRRTCGVVQALDLESYGIYNENNQEVASLSNPKNIDTLVKKFHGQKVYFSRKRRDIEDEVIDESKCVKRAMRTISSNEGFSSKVLNGPYAKVLSTRKYFELNDEICSLLNNCWLECPSMKYFAAKIMAGAIMYKPNTCEALLITTVEVYGRVSSGDPHYEKPRVSFPPKNSQYKHVWPMSNPTTDGLKLIIGTQEFNYLVTASIRVDCIHPAEVGPQTKLFTLDTEEQSRSVKIFIDHEVYEQAKILGQNPECNRVEESNPLYQLRQIRSKFDEIETYDRIRASFDIMDITNDQPVNIFTLGNHGQAAASDDRESWANYVLGSKLFMKIASEVFSRKYKAALEKDVVDSFMHRFKNDKQKIPAIMREILDLFEDNANSIRILYNNDLNRKLMKLANLLAPSISQANTHIMENIKSKLEKGE